VNPSDVLTIADELSERDLAILRSLRGHRLVTTTQLRRLHLPTDSPDTRSATRLTQRVLTRLEGRRLIARLYQRIGGVRRGADSIVWQLAATGDRLLSAMDGDKRRRYLEPRRAFIKHTVAVTELAVQLREAVRAGQLDQVDLTPEPDNWHRFVGQHAQPETLKPDLAAIAVTDDYEDHWLLERDLASEHPTVVVRKAYVYERFVASGAYQDQHGVVPAVLWVVPSSERKETLQRALGRARDLTPGMHRVVTDADFLPTVLAGTTPGLTD
jgi:hypothetical protein